MLFEVLSEHERRSFISVLEEPTDTIADPFRSLIAHVELQNEDGEQKLQQNARGHEMPIDLKSQTKIT